MMMSLNTVSEFSRWTICSIKVPITGKSALSAKESVSIRERCSIAIGTSSSQGMGSAKPNQIRGCAIHPFILLAGNLSRSDILVLGRRLPRDAHRLWRRRSVSLASQRRDQGGGRKQQGDARQPGGQRGFFRYFRQAGRQSLDLFGHVFADFRLR